MKFTVATLVALAASACGMFTRVVTPRIVLNAITNNYHCSHPGHLPWQGRQARPDQGEQDPVELGRVGNRLIMNIHIISSDDQGD